MPEPRPSFWKRLPRPRLSLRALMLAVLVIGGGLGWFIGKVRRQAEAVEFITQEMGGRVFYDWRYRDGEFLFKPATPSWPEWLTKRLGPDYFADVTYVVLKKPPSLYNEELLRRLRAFPRLQHLALNPASHSLTTDADLAVIAQLDHLPALEFHQNVITNDGLVVLSRMTGLRRLEAAYISPNAAGFANFAALKSLRSLEIDAIDLDDAGLAPLAALTELRDLKLITDHRDERHKRVPNPRITSAGLVHLSQLRHLESLDLSGNGITDIGPLANLKSLRELRLGETTLNDKGITVIGELANLEMLSLSGTAITDSALVHLTGLPKLRRLRLEGTGVSDAGMVHLARLANLEKLDLMGTKVTEVGIAKLTGLTRCELIRFNRPHLDVLKRLQERFPGVRLEGYNTGIQPIF